MNPSGPKCFSTPVTLSSVSPFFSPDYYYIDETREAKKRRKNTFCVLYISFPLLLPEGKKRRGSLLFFVRTSLSRTVAAKSNLCVQHRRRRPSQ